jgi:hypothetical protein
MLLKTLKHNTKNEVGGLEKGETIKEEDSKGGTRNNLNNRNNSVDEYKQASQHTKGVAGNQQPDKPDKLEASLLLATDHSWRSGWNWKSIGSLKRLCYENKWNNYSKFKLSNLFKMAGTFDLYTRELSYHILETLAKQLNCELKTSKEITNHHARNAKARYRIGSYTFYFIPIDKHS